MSIGITDRGGCTFSGSTASEISRAVIFVRSRIGASDFLRLLGEEAWGESMSKSVGEYYPMCVCAVNDSAVPSLVSNTVVLFRDNTFFLSEVDTR